MNTQLNNLTTAVQAAVSSSAGLAAVHLAASPGPFDTAPLPAGTLVLARVAGPTDDDVLDGLWQAQFELTLWRRDGQPAANAAALQSLADAVIDALLAEPTHGGLAVPAANGAATRVLAVEPGRHQSPPLGSLLIRFACHLMPADGLKPMPATQRARLDDTDAFASGPHTLAVAGWQRRRIDRAFAGLDGMVSIDLGRSHRPMSLAGRLVDANIADLVAQIEQVESFADGQPHDLAAPDGRTFADVRVDEIRWGRLIAQGDGPAFAGYRIALSQLGS